MALPALYSDLSKDLDVCVVCYENMTAKARSFIGDLKPYLTFEDRGLKPAGITCDFCSRSGSEFAPVFDALKCSPCIGLLEKHPCYLNQEVCSGMCRDVHIPWRRIAAVDGGGGGEGEGLIVELVPELFTERLMIHLLQSEEALRKKPATQELYRAVRRGQASGIVPPEVASSYSFTEVQNSHDTSIRLLSYITEDDIQRYILQLHGVPGMCLRIESDGKGGVRLAKHTLLEQEQSDALLDQYREIALSYVKIPAVKQAAFFLRNNIQKPGYDVGTMVDKEIPLVTYSLKGSVGGGSDVIDETHPQRQSSVAKLLEMTREAGKQFLVILSGSIT